MSASEQSVLHSSTALLLLPVLSHSPHQLETLEVPNFVAGDHPSTFVAIEVSLVVALVADPGVLVVVEAFLALVWMTKTSLHCRNAWVSRC